MMAVTCQLILGVMSGVFFWQRTLFEWDAAGYALVVYFVIQVLSSGMTTKTKQRLRQESLPLYENQCLYCCVPSKGKVALTRLGCLLVVQSMVITSWVYAFYQDDPHVAFFFILLANCIGIVTYYHMTLVDHNLLMNLLYLIVLGLHVVWGLVNSKSI
jgi:hypothetical protein